MTVRAPRKTFRDLLKVDGPLVLPGAHDALSARLIEQAGFEGYFIGGFPAVGARYGVPDVGLKGLGEIAAAVHDILGATDLPVFVDIDDGYGDVKNAVHTMHTYERMGVAAMQIEDQKWPKRCGHMAGKTVVPCEEMKQKSARWRANASTPTRSSGRAPIRAHRLDSMKRCVGPNGTCARAPMRSLSRRRARSKNSSVWAVRSM